MSISSYKDLTVWKKSYDLVKDIYLLTKELPSDERFGLISQIQRSAVSIPSNIAEGQQRHSIKEYVQFLGIAQGSAAELYTQLSLVKDIYNLDVTIHLQQLEEITKMLYSLNQKLTRT